RRVATARRLRGGAEGWCQPPVRAVIGAAHHACGACGAERYSPYNDPPWAHTFREELAAALQPLWPTRAAALRGCGKAAIHLECRSCAAEHYKPARCAARTCPICSRLAAAAVVAKMGVRILEHDRLLSGSAWDGPGRPLQRGWKLVTLTLQADRDVDARFQPDALRRQIRALSALFREFWRRTVWGRQLRDAWSKRK